MVPPPYGPLPMTHQTTTLLIVACVLVALSTTVVGLRIYSRVTITSAKLWWDDYLIVVAQILVFALLALLAIDFQYGVGYHVTDPHVMENLPTGLVLLLLYDALYQITQCAVKLSVLLFYLRIFVNQRVLLATKIAIGVVAVWSTVNFINVFLMCQPFESRFDPVAYVGPECRFQKPIYTAIVCFNVVTDLPIFLLPIPTIWSLKMKKSHKVYLVLSFLFACLVFAATIVRIMYMLQLESGDLTYTGLSVYFWSLAEPNLAMLTISLPMLLPLYFGLRGKKMEETPSAPLQNVKGNEHIVTIGGSGGNSEPRRPRDPYLVDTRFSEDEEVSIGSIHEVRTGQESFDSGVHLTREISHTEFIPPVKVTDGRLL
ncbi:hypothetical protein F5X99DRAFT_382442 [Biscogniauxia marginata]|nr:hypothetical protein F5X99DRAFT_382442 [Biscogniauxia marginata]